MGEKMSDRLVYELYREHDFVLQGVQKLAEVIKANSIRRSVHYYYGTKKTEILRRILSSAYAAKLLSRVTYKFVYPYCRSYTVC